MAFREVWLAVHGSKQNDKYQHDLIRKATYFICASGFNYKVAQRFENLWPGEERKEGEAKISQRALDQLFELSKNKALKSAIKKRNAGRSETHS